MITKGNFTSIIRTIIFNNVIKGGQLLVIDGKKFPLQVKKVLISEIEAKIISNSTTQIIIETPKMQPGLYTLRIFDEKLGNAK